ncbi:unnamed protein product [Urochloa humidicola]
MAGTQPTLAEIQAVLEKSLVKLVCEQPKNEKDPLIVLTGIPIVSEENFCYIITGLNPFSGAAITIRSVVFPDGATMKLKVEDTQFCEGIASIRLIVSSKHVEAVTFSNEDVSNDQELYMIGFAAPQSMGSHIDKCHVSSTGPLKFGHFYYDCPKYLNTSGGEPVFNLQRQMVGMSFEDRGVIVAMTVGEITRLLSSFHSSLKDKELQYILDFFREHKLNCWGRGVRGSTAQKRKARD